MRCRDLEHCSCRGHFLHPQLISCYITEFNAKYESPISDPDPKRQSVILIVATLTGWWFGTFFIFPYIENNHLNWLIFFRGVETTNQIINSDHRVFAAVEDTASNEAEETYKKWQQAGPVDALIPVPRTCWNGPSVHASIGGSRPIKSICFMVKSCYINLYCW